MERMADPLAHAHALDANVLDRGGMTERTGNGGHGTVEPLDRRDRGWTRGAPDRRPPTRTRPMRPPSTVAERYHQYMAGLVQRAFLTPEHPEQAVRSVIFVGVDAGRDAGLLPAAAAEVLAARTAGRVCLVDANFVAPSLHRHYGVTNEQGLAGALSENAPISRAARLLAQGQDSSLWLIPAGTPVHGEEPPLSTPAGVGRIRELIAAFDFVVIDAPAVGRHAAASVLGAEVDGAVLVAEANVTSRRAIRSAADTLRATGTHVLGTVLNNRTFPIPEVIYRLL